MWNMSYVVRLVQLTTFSTAYGYSLCDGHEHFAVLDWNESGDYS